MADEATLPGRRFDLDWDAISKSDLAELVAKPEAPGAVDTVRGDAAKKPPLPPRKRNPEPSRPKQYTPAPTTRFSYKATVPALAKVTEDTPPRVLGAIVFGAPKRPSAPPPADFSKSLGDQMRALDQLSAGDQSRFRETRSKDPASSPGRQMISSKGKALSELVDSLPGEMVAGRYRVDKLLGRGSAGVVFAASDVEREGGATALKMLDPELAADEQTLARFRAEATLPSAIRSDHVVRVFEAGVCKVSMKLIPSLAERAALSSAADGVPFIAMELLQGTDLRSYVHRAGALSRAEATAIVTQLAETLDLAHEQNIVHRDLKLANLFLVENAPTSPMVKILDFGVACLRQSDDASKPSEGFFGTPWYMAPEQVARRPIGPEADRWALGIIAFRLLTSQSYWPPSPIAELLAQILAGPSQAPSDVIAARRLTTKATIGQNFDRWFLKACNLDPTKRFASSEEQASGLYEALAKDERGKTSNGG